MSSPDSHCAALHESHYPLEMPLVDDASIVCEGLRIVCIKFLPQKKKKNFISKPTMYTIKRLVTLILYLYFSTF